MDIFSVLNMVGGLALFLYGMHIMGDSLAKVSGGKLEVILEKFTSSPLRAVLLGAGVTAVIQSSSATTVMVVGFVNSGIMKLGQAVGIIMGANVGTTVTSWILSLTGLEGDNMVLALCKPSAFSPVLALIGVSLILFAKSGRKQDVGTILAGFAILMTGMETMSGAMKPLADNDQFKHLFLLFGENPALGILAGTVLTAVIQSSSASVGILQALCMTGRVPFSSAIPIIMGQNIGTCATALISGVGASKNAKRASFLHLYFNLIGTLIFVVAFYVLHGILDFAFMDQAATGAGIAVVHSVFNLSATLVLLPFRDGLVKLSMLTVRDGKDEEVQQGTVSRFLDERFLERPAFAIAQAKKASVEMAGFAIDAMNQSISLLTSYDKKKAKRVLELENVVDRYEDDLGTYLMRLGNADLSEQDSQRVSLMLHCIGDFERISDHACNIVETAGRVQKKEEQFSEKALLELKVYKKAVREILRLTREVYEEEDVALAMEVEPLKEVVDALTDEVKKRHIKRLRKGKCTINLGFVLSDITTDLERVADHCSNVAIGLLQIEQEGFESHDYLDQLKEEDAERFKRKYKMYRKKYRLP